MAVGFSLRFRLFVERFKKWITKPQLIFPECLDFNTIEMEKHFGYHLAKHLVCKKPALSADRCNKK